MSILVGPPSFNDSVFQTTTINGESGRKENIDHREILIVHGDQFGDNGPSGIYYPDDDDFFSLRVSDDENNKSFKGRIYYYAFDDGTWHDRTNARLGNRPPNFYERRGGRTDAQVLADYMPIIKAFKAGKPSAPGSKIKQDAVQRQAMAQRACISSIKKIVDTCGN